MTDLTAAHLISRYRNARKSVMDYIDLYRQRRALEEMDDAQLKDIGLTRDDVRKEAARPFWDAPGHWLK